LSILLLLVVVLLALVGTAEEAVLEVYLQVTQASLRVLLILLLLVVVALLLMAFPIQAGLLVTPQSLMLQVAARLQVGLLLLAEVVAAVITLMAASVALEVVVAMIVHQAAQALLVRAMQELTAMETEIA
jgi:hypothetical protein